MESEKRYQVFVSSTYEDLREARSAVVAILLEGDAIPAGMELFPATDDDAWTLIESVIDESDYYLLIIGGKYGSIDPATNLSYTEREYDTAIRLGKPVMAFLHGDPGALPAKDTEPTDEGRRKLEAFRRKVTAAKHVKFWSSHADLAGKVAVSWPKLRRQHPATGWVRATEVSAKETLAALAKAQDEVAQLRTQLDQLRTEAPAGTDRLAQGDSKFVLPVCARGEWRMAGSPYKSAFSWTTVELTWDRTFGALGLQMMQEAHEPALEEALSELVLFESFDDVNKALASEIASRAEKAGAEVLNAKLTEATVSSEDFQTILLQFHALGLIQRSDRPRSVKDTGNYWTLTPYGHTRLVQLRALPAGSRSLEHEVLASTPEDAGKKSVPDTEAGV